MKSCDVRERFLLASQLNFLDIFLSGSFNNYCFHDAILTQISGMNK